MDIKQRREMISNVIELQRSLYIKSAKIEDMIDRGVNPCITYDFQTDEGIYIENLLRELLNINPNSLEYADYTSDIIQYAMMLYMHSKIDKARLMEYMDEILSYGKLNEISRQEILLDFGEGVASDALTIMDPNLCHVVFVNMYNGTVIGELVCRDGIKLADNYLAATEFTFDDVVDYRGIRKEIPPDNRGPVKVYAVPIA